MNKPKEIFKLSFMTNGKLSAALAVVTNPEELMSVKYGVHPSMIGRFDDDLKAEIELLLIDLGYAVSEWKDVGGVFYPEYQNRISPERRVGLDRMIKKWVDDSQLQVVISPAKTPVSLGQLTVSDFLKFLKGLYPEILNVQPPSSGYQMATKSYLRDQETFFDKPSHAAGYIETVKITFTDPQGVNVTLEGQDREVLIQRMHAYLSAISS